MFGWRMGSFQNRDEDSDCEDGNMRKSERCASKTI
jgi:hypothetical protein